MKNNMVGGFIALLKGSMFAQALGLASLPIITRLYSQTDIGLMSIFFAIVMIVTPVAMFRYELAITICEKKELNKISNVSLTFLTMTTTLSFVIVLIFDLFYDVSSFILGNYIYIVPLAVILLGIYSITNNILMHQKNYNKISKIKIKQVSLLFLLQVLFYKIGAITLILGQSISYGFYGFIHAFQNIKISLGIVKYKKEIIKYRKFFIYSTPGALFNSLGGQLPTILIGSFFSIGLAGAYGIAQRIVFTPLQIITTNLSNIFFAEAASLIESDELSSKIESLTIILIKLFLPLLLLAFFVIEDISLFVLGDEWVSVGKIIKYMIFWIFFSTLGAPISILYETVDKQHIGLIFQISLLFSRMLTLIYGYYINDFYTGILLFSIFSGLCWLGVIIWVFHYFKVNIDKIIKELFNFFVLSFFVIALLSITSISFQYKISILLLLIIVHIYINIKGLKNDFNL